jgi:hypothetical protein
LKLRAGRQMPRKGYLYVFEKCVPIRCLTPFHPKYLLNRQISCTQLDDASIAFMRSLIRRDTNGRRIPAKRAGTVLMPASILPTPGVQTRSSEMPHALSCTTAPSLPSNAPSTKPKPAPTKLSSSCGSGTRLPTFNVSRQTGSSLSFQLNVEASGPGQVSFCSQSSDNFTVKVAAQPNHLSLQIEGEANAGPEWTNMLGTLLHYILTRRLGK